MDRSRDEVVQRLQLQLTQGGTHRPQECQRDETIQAVECQLTQLWKVRKQRLQLYRLEDESDAAESQYSDAR